jgi:hypothetical protein
MKRVLVLATMMTAAAALGAAEAEARLLDKRDLTALANSAAERVVNDDVDTIHTMLSAQGFAEREIRVTSEKLSSRLVRDVRSFVASMEGNGFDSFEEAERVVAQRRLILRFSALNSPHLYAEGRALSYQVTDTEAARLERSLLATWIEREPLLRKKLEELVMMGEMTDIDVQAIRSWTRKLAMERGKRTIKIMRGAAFFSAADAEYYLECAVVAEIERVRGEKLGDPVQRVRFIEESNTEYGAREAGAPVERAMARPASTPPSVNDERTAAIDFNK